MSYQEPVNQRTMVLDHYRNGFYQRAMQKCITPESVVLDLGAGLGILGFMAAKAGARKVYLVEPETNLEVSKLLAADNGIADRVEFIPEVIEKAQIPEKVDVILSVFTGNFLLEEDLLPSLFYARDKYLKEDGHLIPDQGVMRVAPIQHDDYYEQNLGVWLKQPEGVDHSRMMQYAVNDLYYERFSEHKFLADAQTLHQLNFDTAGVAECRAEVSFSIQAAGMLHGFLGWFDMRLGGDWLSTGPDDEATHWSQVYMPVTPREVNPGDQIDFRLDRPEKGEWSWRLAQNGATEQHSTFLSQPVSPQMLQTQSEQRKPVSGPRMAVVTDLLNQIDGQHTVAELSDYLMSRHPDVFSDRTEALSFVQTQVSRFCD